MPHMTVGEARIHYRITGDPEGTPVLLIAPGGMNSVLSRWASTPWDPTTQLRQHRVIAMDQRNAGGSTAPIRAGEGWDRYTADQIGLMDALGVERFHVIGMCIGGSYIMGLIRHASARIASAVMMQPIGLHQNREAFHQLFDRWAAPLQERHPEADWVAFRHTMFGGDFMFNATPQEVADCPCPILLLRGDDPYHPSSVSDAIAALSPKVQMIDDWKSTDRVAEVGCIIEDFLQRHAPEKRAPAL